MSTFLMSQLIDVNFPTTATKLLAIILARYANPEDGSRIYPSLDTLARQTGTEKRAVRRNLRLLEQTGIIVLMGSGGVGPGDTNTWDMDPETVDRLYWQEILIEGDSKEFRVVDNPDYNPEIRRVLVSPFGKRRRTPEQIRGTPETHKGDTSTLQSTRNSLGNNAGASARDGSRAPPAVENDGRTMFVIRPGDPQWRAWLDKLESAKPDIHRAMLMRSELLVSKLWPETGAMIYTKPKPEPKNNSDRITGDQS